MMMLSPSSTSSICQWDSTVYGAFALYCIGL
jgi:hypothetical protein